MALVCLRDLFAPRFRVVWLLGFVFFGRLVSFRY
jgi:hypothetical protein